MMTPPQRDACGALVRWLRDEWGLPDAYYDTGGNNDARIAPGSFNGTYSHRSVRSSADWHYDYWTQDDFAAMVHATTESTPTEGPNMTSFIYNGQLHTFRVNTVNELVQTWYDVKEGWQTWVLSPRVCSPYGDITYQLDYLGVEGRIDVFAQAEDGLRAGHAWFNPTTGWAWEVL